jgi:hypothetical protein
MIVLVTFVLTIVFSIGYLIGAKQSTKQLIDKIKKDGGYFDMEITGAVYPYKHISVFEHYDTMGSIGSKPKTQTDYQNEHKIPPCVGHDLESQREIEKGDINFMYNWIREKSGKNVKDTKSTPH